MSNVVLENTSVSDNITVSDKGFVYALVEGTTMSLTALLIQQNLVLSMNEGKTHITFDDDLTHYTFSGLELPSRIKQAVSNELDFITEIAMDINSLEDVSWYESNSGLPLSDYLGTKYLIIGVLDGEF